MKILNTEPFLCNIGGLRYLKNKTTKRCSEVDKFKFILATSSTCGLRMASAYWKKVPDRPLIDPGYPYLTIRASKLFKPDKRSHIFFLLNVLKKCSGSKYWGNLFYHINLSQKSHFVLQISQLPKIVQNVFSIQNLRMDLSFPGGKQYVNPLYGLKVQQLL